MSDKCSFRPGTGGKMTDVTDLRKKIEARELRIDHLLEEISHKFDQIHIMRCENVEFKEMLKKEAKQ